MSTPVFSAIGSVVMDQNQKCNPLNHRCLMNGGLISSQFPTGTSTGARCSAAPNTRRCGSPVLTATNKVGSRRATGARTLCGDFGTPPRGDLGYGSRFRRAIWEESRSLVGSTYGYNGLANESFSPPSLPNLVS